MNTDILKSYLYSNSIAVLDTVEAEGEPTIITINDGMSVLNDPAPKGQARLLLTPEDSAPRLVGPFDSYISVVVAVKSETPKPAPAPQWDWS